MHLILYSTGGFEPLVPQVAHDTGTQCYNLKWLKISYYHNTLEYQVVSGHVMAIYLKWHMCPCYEPLVPLISICPNTSSSIV